MSLFLNRLNSCTPWLLTIVLTAGCIPPGLPPVDASSKVQPVPQHVPATFRSDVERLISEKRYQEAVELISAADPMIQADYDNRGFLAVAEDMIVLPGVHSEMSFESGRDWEIPGTSDAVESRSWQQVATEFARRYNSYRLEK